jgi:hypothetical protein
VKPTKKPVSIRLSETSIKELETLCKREKLSQASVISVLLHCAWLGDIEQEKLDEWFEIARISG